MRYVSFLMLTVGVCLAVGFAVNSYAISHKLTNILNTAV